MIRAWLLSGFGISRRRYNDGTNQLMRDGTQRVDIGKTLHIISVSYTHLTLPTIYSV